MNNYNQSSTGENIELHCFYDGDLSQIYFNDFESENTRIDFGRDSIMFLIGDADKPYFSELDLKAKSKQAIFDLCLDFNFIDYSVSLNDYKKSEYISDLLKVTHKQYYELITSQFYWHDLKEKIQHDFYISRGYSQGDAVYIVSIDKPIDNAMREYINHILWDSPVYIRAKINDNEYDEDSFLNDLYEWDRYKIIERIKGLSISQYAKEWLINALPEYPAYN